MAEQATAPNRLLGSRKGCERLDVSVDQQARREKDPPAPNYPIRRVIGRTKTGRPILAFSENEIDEYIRSLPRVERASPSDRTATTA